MNLFSISQLAQYSGIKPHTIRMWEKRYHALKPNRTEGNTRYYDNMQLRRLLNIVSLLDEGHKVSKLCAMPDQQLFALIDEKSSTVQHVSSYYISQLIAAAMSYDEQYFSNTFSHCLLRYGMKETYLQVVYPMLIRIGLMWLSDTMPAPHEHFISNLLRQKLFTAIDALAPPKKAFSTWLLFLPENEFHEIGLLFAAYLIRISGDKVIYLGSNVPEHSLGAAINDIMPDYLLLFLVHHDLPSDVHRNVVGQRHRFRFCFPLENRDFRLEIRRLNVGGETPLEARA